MQQKAKPLMFSVPFFQNLIDDDFSDDEENNNDQIKKNSDIETKQNNDCIICFAPCDEITECNHYVHKQCIVRWGKPECPICRRKISFDQEEEKKASENRLRNQPDDEIPQEVFREFIGEAIGALLHNMFSNSYNRRPSHMRTRSLDRHEQQAHENDTFAFMPINLDFLPNGYDENNNQIVNMSTNWMYSFAFNR